MNVDGGAVAVGAAVDVSTIEDTTTATLIGARLNANGAILVEANSTGAINDTAGGASGGLVGLAATILIDHINSDTEATAESDGGIATQINQDKSYAGSGRGPSDTQAVTFDAAGDADIDGTAGSVGVGLVGAGAAIHVGGIDDRVAATVGTGVDINAAGNITVAATDTRELDSLSFAGAGGLGALAGAFSILSIGGAFDGSTASEVNQGNGENSADLTSTTNSMLGQVSSSKLYNADDSSVASDAKTKYAHAGVSVNDPLANAAAGVSGVFAMVGGSGSGGAPVLRAGGNIDITASNQFGLNDQAGSGAGGAVSVGVGVELVDVTDTVTAEAGGGAVLSAGGAIEVSAGDSTDKHSTASATVGTFGFLAGLGGSVSNLTLNLDVTAALDQGATVLSAAAVEVEATQSADLESDGDNVEGGAVAAGVVSVDVTVTGAVTAKVDAGSTLGSLASPIGTLSISATANDVGVTNGTASAGGAAAGVGALADTDIAPSLDAFLGDDAILQSDSNVSITTASSGSASATASGVDVAAGQAIGISKATATYAPEGEASIGAGAILTIGGGLTLDSTDTTTGSVNATANASGGGAISGDGALAVATDGGSGHASVGEGALVIAQGTVEVWSTVINNASASTDVASYGFAAAGGQQSDVNVDGSAIAETGANVGILAYALQVEAAASGGADAQSTASTGGVVSGVASSANIDLSPKAEATVGADDRIGTLANVDVFAIGETNAIGSANGTNSFSGLGGAGDSDATVKGSPDIEATIARGAQVNAGGGVSVLAQAPWAPHTRAATSTPPLRFPPPPTPSIWARPRCFRPATSSPTKPTAARRSADCATAAPIPSST